MICSHIMHIITPFYLNVIQCMFTILTEYSGQKEAGWGGTYYMWSLFLDVCLLLLLFFNLSKSDLNCTALSLTSLSPSYAAPCSDEQYQLQISTLSLPFIQLRNKYIYYLKGTTVKQSLQDAFLDLFVFQGLAHKLIFPCTGTRMNTACMPIAAPPRQ